MILLVFQVQILHNLIYFLLASFDEGPIILLLNLAIHGNLVTIIISHYIGKIILLIIVFLHDGQLQLSVRVIRIFFNIS